MANLSLDILIQIHATESAIGDYRENRCFIDIAREIYYIYLTAKPPFSIHLYAKYMLFSRLFLKNILKSFALKNTLVQMPLYLLC